MASTQAFNTNLQLDMTISQTGIPKDLYSALYSIIQSLNVLAGNLDVYGGVAKLADTDVAGIIANADTYRSNSLVRLTSFSLIAGEDLSYGNLVQIGTDGLAYKSTLAYVGSVPRVKVVGFVVSEEVASGKSVKIASSGLLRIQSPAGGQLYPIQPTGYAGRVTGQYPHLQYAPAANAITTQNMAAQVIASYVDASNVVLEI